MVWFPDVTASVFEVPAAADVFGHYIFESYADAAAINMHGGHYLLSQREKNLTSEMEGYLRGGSPTEINAMRGRIWCSAGRTFSGRSYLPAGT